MTFVSTDKMKLSVLVVSFLLLVSAFTFLPAVGAFSPTTVAKIGSTPASITGAAASIDVPIYAAYNTNITRTISISNPIGNTAISTFTISIPKAAVGTGNPTATVYAGSPGATVSVYGTGPWAVVYTGAGSPAVLVPGGATVKVTISLTTEATFASTSGVADAYSLSTAATDTTGASTNLNTFTIFECSNTAPTVTAATGTLIAGTPFTVTVKGADSGLPLTVRTYATASNTSDTNKASTTTTLAPTSYTTGVNTGSQSITVNDTTAELLSVAVTGGTITLPSAGGAIFGNSTAMTINAGALTALAVKISSLSSSKLLNITTTQLGLNPIPGANISVSTADKYGNPVLSTGSTSVLLTADTFAGQAAGFNATTASVAYTGTYPYTPTAGVLASLSLTIPNGQSTVHPVGVYFFGVDYGSQSQLIATSSSGLATGKSAMITTYTLSSTALVLSPSSTVSVKAGSSYTVGVALAIAQKNVPVAFGFSGATTYKGSYSSTGTNATTSLTTVNSNNVGIANATINVATKLGASVNFNATESYTAKLKATPVIASGALVTAAGALAKLTVLPYFAASSGSQSVATTVVPSGSVYVNVTATDAYGNLKTVSGATQLSLSATAGTLSITIPVITSGLSSTNASGVSILFVAPSTIGTVATISASGVASGTAVTGSATLTVVSKIPLLAATGPATWTSGIPSTISGTTNASTGIVNNKITTITYSVNGGTAQPVAFTSAANVAFSFSVLLTGASNVNITVKDTAGNSNWQIVQVPPLPTGQTFTAPTGASNQPKQYQFPNGGPQAVNSTFTNNGAQAITIIVIANIFTSPGGIPITPSPSATATVAAGATVSTFELLNGLAHGTYTVTINVYTTAFVSLSPSYTVTVTV